QSWPSSTIIARLIAFIRGWLSIVSTTTCEPCLSTRMVIASVRLGARRRGGRAPPTCPRIVHPRPWGSSSRASLWQDDDLSVGLAVRQEPDRFHAPLERQPVGDQRTQLPVAIPLEQLLDRRPELVRRMPAEVAQRRAERRAMLDEQA